LTSKRKQIGPVLAIKCGGDNDFLQYWYEVGKRGRVTYEEERDFPRYKKEVPGEKRLH